MQPASQDEHKRENSVRKSGWHRHGGKVKLFTLLAITTEELPGRLHAQRFNLAGVCPFILKKPSPLGQDSRKRNSISRRNFRWNEEHDRKTPLAKATQL